MSNNSFRGQRYKFYVDKRQSHSFFRFYFQLDVLRGLQVAYRLFAFWDKDKETLVIATHGIIKKTQKTPNKEIAKAEAIRREYFKNK